MHETSRSAVTLRLVVVDGPDKGQTLTLGSETFTIGRQDGNDLQLREPQVSRRHCEVAFVEDDGDDGAYEIRDLGSTQGTFVDHRPIHRRRLRHGDMVRVGETVLLFLEEGTEAVRQRLDAAATTGSTVEKSPSEIAELLRGGRSTPRTESGSETASGSGVLLRVATVAQQARTSTDLAERLLDLLVDVLPVEQGAVLDEPPERGAARTLARRGGGDLLPSRSVLARTREGVAVWWDAVESGDDLEAESLRAGRARSVLAAPLAGRRDLHGVLYLESSRIGALGEDDLELVATAAALAGLAFDTVRALGDLRDENRRLRGGADHGMVGESAEMERLLDFVGRVGPVDSTVLLRGESGTGKELVASALHAASPRADGPFVAINCATLSETLLESELFGHERGAFTGAVQRKVGKFEAADSGTLFLDEIGELPVTLQARLLRALQERRFERVGGTRPIEVDVRVLAATHRDLERAIADGAFREDLFYRLNVITCQVPPLRDRRRDVPLLARHFARRIGERLGRPGVGFDPVALRALVAYDWPGNVRQLANAIERALVLGDGERIRLDDLPDEVLDRVALDRVAVDRVANDRVAADGGEGGRGTAGETADGAEIEVGEYQAVLTETKKRLLTTALDAADGNAAEAGRRLGLHPNSFRRLMRQLGLRDESG